MPPARPTGMAGFLVVWLGQVVSVLATGMTGFALTIWVYQMTESATALAMMQVFYITPFLLISPVAGVLVDRHSRKLMMVVSDLGAGLSAVGILALQALGLLEVWHLYAAAAIAGTGNAFQWPAYSAAITTMIPKEQYGRANGLMSLMEAGPGVLAPLLAGTLLPLIGLTGILLIDVVTFLFAIGALLVVHVPQPRRSAAGLQAQGSMLKEAAYGFRYIFARPSLLGLQLIFLFGNLFSGVGFTLLAPMILARTANDSLTFGMTQSAGAIGGVVGGILMSLWGGFRRRVHGVLLGWMLFALLGFLPLGMGQGLAVWLPAMVFSSLFSPLVNASNQAIWQAKVAPDLQGRVFTARRLIAWLSTPISPLIAGTLADFVLEPAMRSGGGLTALFGGLFGTGPGAGMGLLVSLCGLSAALVGLAGYFVPQVRRAEDLLPDHDLAAGEEPVG
jgi:MFS transporter, DHA3 family, macrolide efflux protein